MQRSTGAFTEWLIPLAFILCGGWVVWHGPAYIMAFGGFTDALAARYPSIDILDYIALAATPILFVTGAMTVRRADMEFEGFGITDRMSIFIGRVTMLLIALIVGVMFYEVMLRYVFESPTLWANELSLWLAGFVFVFAGLYAMQQRSHIRIFLLYDVMPRWLQKVCDTFSTLLIVLFAVAMIYGGYGEAEAKFLRWETFGTAFDPPLPATMKPTILAVIALVALQAVSNLISDWSKDKEKHAVVDDVDVDEIASALGTPVKKD
ncbi:MAG: TRAP transporter small permease [Pseudomonadota bacterium]